MKPTSLPPLTILSRAFLSSKKNEAILAGLSGQSRGQHKSLLYIRSTVADYREVPRLQKTRAVTRTAMPFLKSSIVQLHRSPDCPDYLL